MTARPGQHITVTATSQHWRDAERRDRIKRGEAARTYSFMVCSITSGRSDSAEIDEKEIK